MVGIQLLLLILKIMINNLKIESNTANISDISYSVYLLNKLIGSFNISSKHPQYLTDLFIDREYRRKGIARYLLNKFKIAKLRCTTWNEVGISFYTSLGFIRDETQSDIYVITFVRKLDV